MVRILPLQQKDPKIYLVFWGFFIKLHYVKKKEKKHMSTQKTTKTAKTVKTTKTATKKPTKPAKPAAPKKAAVKTVAK